MPDTQAHSCITDEEDANESLLIHDIARLCKIAFDRKMRPLNLTRAQWLVLATLRRQPGISQAQLAEKLDVQPITVTRTLDRMERAGWVERKVSKDDRRIKHIYLTPRVQDVVLQIRSLAFETRRDMLAGVSQQEYETLLSVLKRMRQNICHKTKTE